jgi:hypothetical protein
MLFINKKYKPMITKQSDTKEKEQDFTPNIQGKGLNELIEKVKDMKVKELTKKRITNSNSKISFNYNKILEKI